MFKLVIIEIQLIAAWTACVIRKPTNIGSEKRIQAKNLKIVNSIVDSGPCCNYLVVLPCTFQRLHCV